MTEIYWLLIIAVGVLASVITSLIYEKDYFVGRYMKWKNNRLKQRDKRFKSKYKRTIRAMVREYLNELKK